MTAVFNFVAGTDEPAASKWRYVMFEGVYVPRLGCPNCATVIRLGKGTPNFVHTLTGEVSDPVVCPNSDFNDLVLLNDWGNWP